MKDRVPRYPGRVKLTPVSGQANTYDMTMADQPTVEGTPLNKQTFLTDATAAALGLSGDPTVDDALRALADLVSNLNVEHIVTGSYSGTGLYDSSHKTTLSFNSQPKLVAVFAYAVSSYNYTTTFFLWPNMNTNQLRFFKANSNSPSSVTSVTWSNSGKTVSWYSSSANAQLNESGATYYYLALL